MDRMRYMESILKHHFPHLALDINSLRRTCDSLSSPTPPRNQNDVIPEPLEPSENVEVSDSPDIGDENCTIDRVDGTTFRTCFLILLVTPHAP
jgi:hypothetical protein